MGGERGLLFRVVGVHARCECGVELCFGFVVFVEYDVVFVG